MLIFYAGAKYPETIISIVISAEEYWAGAGSNAVRYPDVLWHGASVKVADEAARDAWIAAKNTWLEADDDMQSGWRGGWKLSIEKRNKYDLIMQKAQEEMSSLEIEDSEASLEPTI